MSREPLVGADFELFARLLVDVRRAQHGELLDPGGQRNRSANLGPGALRRVSTISLVREIEDAMVERLQPDAYVLVLNPSCSLL